MTHHHNILAIQFVCRFPKEVVRSRYDIFQIRMKENRVILSLLIMISPRIVFHFRNIINLNRILIFSTVCVCYDIFTISKAGLTIDYITCLLSCFALQANDTNKWIFVFISSLLFMPSKMWRNGVLYGKTDEGVKSAGNFP